MSSIRMHVSDLYLPWKTHHISESMFLYPAECVETILQIVTHLVYENLFLLREKLLLAFVHFPTGWSVFFLPIFRIS